MTGDARAIAIARFLSELEAIQPGEPIPAARVDYLRDLSLWVVRELDDEVRMPDLSQLAVRTLAEVTAAICDDPTAENWGRWNGAVDAYNDVA